MRTLEDLKFHYDVEKELADKLRGAKPEDRTRLYGEMYDELFRRVPNHPQLTRKRDPREQDSAVDERLELLSRFLQRDSVFLEIGAGDGSLCSRVAESVKKSYALDVSRDIFDKNNFKNVEFVLSDGRSIGVPSELITVAYSYQVMEHIHPDDAREQLINIYGSLAWGGLYVCVTPNRLNGPHDVSRHFDVVAKGFHLKEYTVRELRTLFLEVGFRSVRAYVGVSRKYFQVPLAVLASVEWLLDSFPHPLRRGLGNFRGIRNLLFISLVAEK